MLNTLSVTALPASLGILAVLLALLAVAVTLFVVLLVYYRALRSQAEAEWSESVKKEKRKQLKARRQVARAALKAKNENYRTAKMTESFVKLKRKFLLVAIIESVIFGVSCGLLTVGIVLLALKLSAIEINVLYYVLIGVGAALISGGIAFLILRPTNKKVAERLDNEYSLNEKVQTALEYNKHSGTVVELQREDADEKLKTLPKHKPKLSRICRCCAIALVAVAVAITAFMVPAKTVASVNPNLDNTPFAATEIQLGKIRELITNVSSSELKPELKTPIVAELQEFLADIEAADTEGKKQQAIYDTIGGVDEVIAGATSYLKISGAMTNIRQAFYLGQAISSSGNLYRSFTWPETLKEYEQVKTFYSQRADLVNRLTSTPMASLRESFLNDPASINRVSSEIVGALALTGYTDADELYALVMNFATELIRISSSSSVPQESVTSIFSEFESKLSEVMGIQAYNCVMDTYICNKIRDIFSMPCELPEQPADTSENPENPDDPDNPVNPDDPDKPGGGGGSGETQYAGQDEIYDPDEGLYVKYGTLLDRYMQMVEELIRSGKAELTEEQKEIVRNYFSALYGN